MIPPKRRKKTSQKQAQNSPLNHPKNKKDPKSDKFPVWQPSLMIVAMFCCTTCWAPSRRQPQPRRQWLTDSTLRTRQERGCEVPSLARPLVTPEKTRQRRKRGRTGILSNIFVLTVVFSMWEHGRSCGLVTHYYELSEPTRWIFAIYRGRVEELPHEITDSGQ